MFPMYGAILVPKPNIIALMVSGALCVFGPLTVFLVLRKPLSLKFIPFVSGAALHMVFVLLLKNQFLYLLCGDESPFYDALVANPALYMLVVGFSTGLIEEGGRFILFNILKRWYDDFPVSVSSTLGFSSIDSVYYVGVRFIVYSVIAIGHNSLVLAGSPDPDYRTLVFTLSRSVPSEYLLAGLERFLYAGIHIGLATLVWYAVTKPGRTYLFYGSILLHAIFSAPSALREIHVLNSMSLYTVVMAAFALIIIVIALLVYRADMKSRTKESDPFSLF